MKSFHLLLFLMLCGLASDAQFLKVGAKAGANMVKIDGVSFENSFQVGYYAGGFVEIKLGEKFYLMPELLFSETNLSTTTDFRNIYRDLLSLDTLKGIRLQALSLPISLNWRLANVFALSGGAMFTRNMKKGEGLLDNAESAIRSGDIALMAGANFMFSKFRINARYLRGISEQNNIDGRDPWKQQTIQLGVGFVF